MLILKSLSEKKRKREKIKHYLFSLKDYHFPLIFSVTKQPIYFLFTPATACSSAREEQSHTGFSGSSLFPKQRGFCDSGVSRQPENGEANIWPETQRVRRRGALSGRQIAADSSAFKRVSRLLEDVNASLVNCRTAADMRERRSFSNSSLKMLYHSSAFPPPTSWSLAALHIKDE